MKGLGCMTESDIIQASTDSLNSTDIKAVQVKESDSRVNTVSFDTKQFRAPVNIKGKALFFNDVCRSVTNVTVKDAPYQMDDDSLISAFEEYSEVVRNRGCCGVVKDTKIQIGTRYLGLYDTNELILTVEDQDCKKEMVCRFSAMTGHIESRCKSHQELEDKEMYGEYYNDIREGRIDKPGGVKPDEGDRNRNKIEEKIATSTPDDPELIQNENKPNHTPILGDSNVRNYKPPQDSYIQGLRTCLLKA